MRVTQPLADGPALARMGEEGHYLGGRSHEELVFWR